MVTQHNRCKQTVLYHIRGKIGEMQPKTFWWIKYWWYTITKHCWCSKYWEFYSEIAKVYSSPIFPLTLYMLGACTCILWIAVTSNRMQRFAFQWKINLRQIVQRNVVEVTPANNCTHSTSMRLLPRFYLNRCACVCVYTFASSKDFSVFLYPWHSSFQLVIQTGYWYCMHCMSQDIPNSFPTTCSNSKVVVPLFKIYTVFIHIL